MENPTLKERKPRLFFWIERAVAVSVVAAVPAFHMEFVNVFFDKYRREVNRKDCSCSCWDTVFKANFEHGSSTTNFKHVYFNVTLNTLKIWLVTTLALIAFYECVKWIVHLTQRNRIRKSVLFLFASGIHSHYYAWWMMFNYWNDDFYNQWNHQMLYTISEIASTVFVVQQMDSSVPINLGKLVFITAIGVGHSLSAFTDQFLSNVLMGQGELHQILRDLSFMVNDILSLFICWREVKLHAKKHLLPPSHLLSNSMVAGVLIFTILWWSICRLV